MGHHSVTQGPQGYEDLARSVAQFVGRWDTGLPALDCVQDLALGPCRLDLQELSLC